jgi:N-acetyl-anhydromuramyl-L-alanine amidase AmpD
MRSEAIRVIRGILAASLLLSLLFIPRGADSARSRKQSRWRYIVIHHSATRKGNAFIMDRYHKNRRHMVNGLAYHFVIDNGTSGTRDGEVEEGMRWRRQIPGGHVRQAWLNEGGIGICLVGNFNRYHPSRKQTEALISLVDRLRKRYGIPIRSIKGHREWSGERSECPGRYLSMTRLRERLKDMDLRETERKNADRKAGSPAGSAARNGRVPPGIGHAG